MALKSLGNITVTYNSNALTGHLNSASLAAVVAALPTTVLNSTSGTKIAGLADWTISIGGPWSSTLHGYLNPDTVTPPSTLRTLVIVVGGAVTYTWTENSFVDNYSFTADPSALLVWTGSLAVSGPPTMS